MTKSTTEEIAARIAPLIAEMIAAALPPPERDDDLIPLETAARNAATSPRVLRDAIRRGDLPAFGKQRDRAVRRVDLKAWIESRKVVHLAVEDADLERRMRRIGGAK